MAPSSSSSFADARRAEVFGLANDAAAALTARWTSALGRNPSLTCHRTYSGSPSTLEKSLSIFQFTGGGCRKAIFPSSYTAAERPFIHGVPRPLRRGVDASDASGAGNSAAARYFPHSTSLEGDGHTEARLAVASSFVSPRLVPSDFPPSSRNHSLGFSPLRSCTYARQLYLTPNRLPGR